MGIRLLLASEMTFSTSVAEPLSRPSAITMIALGAGSALRWPLPGLPANSETACASPS